MGKKCCLWSTIGVSIGVAIIIILSVVLSGIRYVQLGHVGLDLNDITQTVDYDTIYSEGRHYLGVGHSFIEFPITARTIQFINAGQVRAQTLDGLPLGLDISFQYRIKREGVPDLFRKLYIDYESTLRVLADAAMRRVASEHRAIEFFYDRNEVGNDLFRASREILLPFGVNVTFHQLRRIDLPDPFENAIVATEVERQAVQTKLHAQDAAHTRAKKNLVTAETDFRIKEIEADTFAQTLTMQRAAEAEAVTIVSRAYADANKYLMEQLQFGEEELMSYRYIEALEGHTTARFLMGLENMVVLQQ